MPRDRRSSRTKAIPLAFVLLGPLFGSCAKSDEEWVADLSSSDSFVSGLAAIAIAQQAPERGKDAVGALLEVVDGRRGLLRPHVPWALARLAPDATDEMVRCLFETSFISEENRTALEDVLVALGGPAIPALVAAFDGPAGEHAPAISALVLRIGDPAIDPLTTALREDTGGSARVGAAWLLGRLGPAARRALPELEAARQGGDPDLARVAAESLQRIDSL